MWLQIQRLRFIAIDSHREREWKCHVRQPVGGGEVPVLGLTVVRGRELAVGQHPACDSEELDEMRCEMLAQPFTL